MKPIGHQIIRLEEADSTNTLLLENPEYLGNHGLVMIARHQTAGRGRMGRQWASIPDAQLQFSVVMHPDIDVADIPLVSLAAGVAVADALEAVTGVSPRLKWPNDVMIDQRKVCGILVETQPGQGKSTHLVVGIGINCLGGIQDYPQELRDILTTVAEASAKPVDKEALLLAVLRNLEAQHTLLRRGGKADLLQAWRKRGALQGRRVRVETPNGEQEGVALDLSEAGFLVVRLDSGETHHQVSGNVVWLN